MMRSGILLALMALAACGYLNPVIAALLMVASSAIVAMNSLRLGSPVAPDRVELASIDQPTADAQTPRGAAPIRDSARELAGAV